MNFKNLITRCMVVLFLCLVLVSSASAKKLKVAIIPFDDASITNWWGGQEFHPGSGIADMLVTQIVNSKKFDVIERTQIDAVLKEQGFGQTGMVDPAQAPQLGKLLAVDLIITGKVTRFDFEEKEIKASRLKLGILGSVSIKTTYAHCMLDAKAIDVTTGKIMFAVQGKGDKDKKGFSIQGTNWAKIDFNSSDFMETILGQATQDAVNQVVAKLVEQAGSTEGKVLKVSEGLIYVTFTKDEVKVGDELECFHKGEELVDPDTGESYGAEETKAGTIKIEEVGDKYSKASVVIGDIKVGDIVRFKK